MKRLNPSTGAPLKHGDVREDGHIFIAYDKKRIKSNGVFIEIWASPNTVKRKTIHSHARYTQINDRARTLFNSAKTRARKNSANVTITQDWVYEKIQKGICELTQIPFDLSKSEFKTNPYSPSLDRIDSSNKDYTKENTRLVLSLVNVALNQWGLDTALPILSALVQNATPAKLVKDLPRVLAEPTHDL